MASDPTPRGTGPEGKTQQKRKRVDEVPSADAGDDSANKRARLASDLHITSDEDKRALELVNSRCDVQIHSVISSSKIQKKITSVLRHLTTTNATKPRVSVLRAKAADAGKLISISEIAKRELARGQANHEHAGKWFQYIGLGEEVIEVPRDVEGRTIVKDTILGTKGAAEVEEVAADKTKKKEADAADEDDGDFEYMKTPFERAIEGRPRKRAVAMMSLFLSRVPIPELSKRYGEQTNPETTEGKT